MLRRALPTAAIAAAVLAVLAVPGLERDVGFAVVLPRPGDHLQVRIACLQRLSHSALRTRAC